VLVAGDVGPTGCLLPPTGTASPAELEDAFAAQTQALAEAGVDLLSLETMYDLREALAATRAAVATELPVLCSMTFEVRPRGIFTIMGDELTAALGALAEAGAHAIGFNCSVTSSVMIQMVTRARAAMTLPLVAQPNAGQPRATAQGIVYDARPAEFAADQLRMVTEGARIVGGCCGTTPAFISAARQALIGGGALAGHATPQ